MCLPLSVPRQVSVGFHLYPSRQDTPSFDFEFSPTPPETSSGVSTTRPVKPKLESVTLGRETLV